MVMSADSTFYESNHIVIKLKYFYMPLFVTARCTIYSTAASSNRHFVRDRGVHCMFVYNGSVLTDNNKIASKYLNWPHLWSPCRDYETKLIIF